MESTKYVRDQLHSCLKAEGFGGRAATWNRAQDEIIQVLNLQGSRYNEAGAESFTINLGVFLPSVYAICHESPAPRFITEPVCILRTRIGPVITNCATGPDVWWDVNDTNKGDIANEVVTVVLDKALPFYERMRESEAIVDFMETRKDWQAKDPQYLLYAATIRALLGQRERTREMLTRLTQDKNCVSWTIEIHRVARTFDLIADSAG